MLGYLKFYMVLCRILEILYDPVQDLEILPDPV